MNDNFRSFARIGLVDTYLEISIDCYNKYNKYFKELHGIVSKHSEKYDEVSDKIRKETIKFIVFLTTFLESYINEFAGIALGDGFSKEHLDKLSIISKWVLIPKLITGNELDRSISYYSDFKDLIKWRNKLIHHKSKNAIEYINTIDESKLSTIKPIYELFDIESMIKMIRELFRELDRIDKKGFHFDRINRVLNKIE